MDPLSPEVCYGDYRVCMCHWVQCCIIKVMWSMMIWNIDHRRWSKKKSSLGGPTLKKKFLNTTAFYLEGEQPEVEGVGASPNLMQKRWRHSVDVFERLSRSAPHLSWHRRAPSVSAPSLPTSLTAPAPRGSRPRLPARGGGCLRGPGKKERWRLLIVFFLSFPLLSFPLFFLYDFRWPVLFLSVNHGILQ